MMRYYIFIFMYKVDTNNKYQIIMIDSCESRDSYMLYFFKFLIVILVDNVYTNYLIPVKIARYEH